MLRASMVVNARSPSIVSVQIVELRNSSNKWSKFMRAAHSNLQRQNTMYSHKKYVILQHLLLMRLIVDMYKMGRRCQTHVYDVRRT